MESGKARNGMVEMLCVLMGMVGKDFKILLGSRRKTWSPEALGPRTTSESKFGLG